MTKTRSPLTPLKKGGHEGASHFCRNTEINGPKLYYLVGICKCEMHQDRGQEAIKVPLLKGDLGGSGLR
ncbi:hypothetical protein C7B67_03620 [filamentous cyanobacterium Phorm 6]|nr:hypothetical protein C7B67_03620 [filamentous cyanobacterium Phorm 6]